MRHLLATSILRLAENRLKKEVMSMLSDVSGGNDDDDDDNDDDADSDFLDFGNE